MKKKKNFEETRKLEIIEVSPKKNNNVIKGYKSSKFNKYNVYKRMH